MSISDFLTTLLNNMLVKNILSVWLVLETIPPKIYIF